MGYATPAQVRNRILQLGESGNYDNDNLNEFIDRADHRINARLARLYDVPFGGTAPPFIAVISADLAAAYVIKFQFPPAAAEEGNPARVYEEQAEAWLDQIAEGDAKLLDSDGNAIERQSGQYQASIMTPKDSDYLDQDGPVMDTDDMLNTFDLER